MLFLIAPLSTRENNVYELDSASSCYAVLGALLCTMDIRPGNELAGRRKFRERGGFLVRKRPYPTHILRGLKR